MLDSARSHYEQQQRLTAQGLTQARNAASRGSGAVARVVGQYQTAAAIVGEAAVPEMLAEQGIDSTAVASVNTATVATDRRVMASMLEQVASNAAFDRLVTTSIQDAGRTATGLASVVRPAVTGYARYLNPPSCSRCAILAGRVYRWSQGFKRHPHCDCQMMPTTMTAGPDLISDPMVAFERGQIRGLSKADTQALHDGADVGQVVNIRRKTAGLTDGTSVLTRGGRLTPAGIYRVAKSRDEAIALLSRHGYVVDRPNVVAIKAAKPRTVEAPELGTLTDAELRKMLMSTPAEERAPIVAEMQSRLTKSADTKLATLTKADSALTDAEMATLSKSDRPQDRQRWAEERARRAGPETPEQSRARVMKAAANAGGSRELAQQMLDQKTGEAWRRSIPLKPEGLKRRGLDTVENDLRATNPNYHTGPEYQTNCTNAVTTFELRRRGYNVQAAPSTEEMLRQGGRDLAEVYRSWGHAAPTTRDGVSNLTHSQMLERASSFGEGARGGITIVWKDSGAAHSFSWEIQNGQPVFFDAQSGKSLGDGSAYLKDAKERVHIFRMDDLPVTDSLRGALKSWE